MSEKSVCNRLDDVNKALKEATIWKDSLLAANSSYVYIALDVIDALNANKKYQLKRCSDIKKS